MVEAICLLKKTFVRSFLSNWHISRLDPRVLCGMLCNQQSNYKNCRSRPSRVWITMLQYVFAQAVVVNPPILDNTCDWEVNTVTLYWMKSTSKSFLCLRFQTVFPCSYPGCGIILKSKHTYQQHVKRHMGIYQFQCPYCNKGINRTNDMKEHLKKYHTGIRGFHCIKCQQEFTSVHQLKDHLAICTGSAGPTLDIRL